jgi:threonine dehydrogenase-like Zn-dependent dehydrogenase
MYGGDIPGHEIMGEIVEVGSENKKLKIGDRVVVPFTISCGCGECFFCKRGLFSGCGRSSPHRAKAGEMWGISPAGFFAFVFPPGAGSVVAETGL